MKAWHFVGATSGRIPHSLQMESPWSHPGKPILLRTGACMPACIRLTLCGMPLALPLCLSECSGTVLHQSDKLVWGTVILASGRN